MTPPAIVISVNAEGTIVRASRAAADYFEYTPEELFGQPIGFLFLDRDQPTESRSADQTRLPFPLYLEHVSASAQCRSGRTVGCSVTVSELFSSTVREYLLVVSPLESPVSRIMCSLAISAQELQRESHLQSELFRSIYEHSAVGMAVCDPAGRYISVNPAMCALVGYSEHELLARTYMDITCPEDVAGNIARRTALLESSGDVMQLEKRYVHKSGRLIWALLVVSSVRDESGRPIYTVGQTMSIDDLKRSEMALRQSGERLANAQQIAHMGDWEWNIFEEEIKYSDEILRILEMKNKPLKITRELLLSRVHPDDYQSLVYFVEHSLAECKPFRVDFRIRPDDGAEKHVHLIAEIVSCDIEGRPARIFGTIQNITERKAYEKVVLGYQEQVRNLATYSNLMVETERKRIARDMHDEIGQLLTALKIDMQLCKLSATDNPLIQQKSDEMLDLVDQVIAAVHAVTYNLRPPALDIGLIPAIEWLAQDVSRRTSLRFLLDIAPIDDHLDDEMATTIFRVTQESITNIVRHAAATEVVITLNKIESLLKLQIRDNGRGFVVNRKDQVWGFGLLGMSERIISLGGLFYIDSEVDGGTTVNIEVALTK